MTSALAQLGLLPRDGQGIPGQCHLGIIQADDRILVVAIPRSAGRGHWSERGYTLSDSKFIPRYPFRGQHPHSDSSGWAFTVVQSPRVPDVHEFATRKAALEFQRFVTGYVTVDKGHCEEVVWDAMIMRRWGQNRKYIGEGEMQLWLPVEQLVESSPPASRGAGQFDYQYPSDDRLPDLARVQTGESSSSRFVPQPDHNQTIFHRDRPPLLVAFLRDSKDRRRYSMMSVSVAELTPNRNSEQPDMLNFQRDDGFKVKSLEADENNLNAKFDVAGFARNYSPDAESIKLVSLRISAQNQDQLRVFRAQLEDHMTRYATRQQRAARLRHEISRGKATTSSPASSALSFRDRRKSSSSSIMSFLPRVDTSSVFPAELRAGDLDTVPERYELHTDDVVRSQTRIFASSLPPTEPTATTGWASHELGSHISPRQQQPPASRGGTIGLTRSASSATASTSARGRRPATSTTLTFASSSSGSTTSGNSPGSMLEHSYNEVFTDLDSRIRRFMQHEPGLGSAHADETIRRLHSLPGGLRALLYEFGSMPACSSSLDGGSPQRRRRRFRCPFDIVYPQNGVNTGCQGPGFYPLERLWTHLEKHHSSYDCSNCLADFHDDSGIDQHSTDGCRVKSTALARRVPYARLVRVERILRGDYTRSLLQMPDVSERELEIERERERLREKEEIERWNKLWDVLFPSLAPTATADGVVIGSRPSPFLTAPPTISHDTNLARLEMIFAAIVESCTTTSTNPTMDHHTWTGNPAAGRPAAVQAAGAGAGNGKEMISKTNAKRCLRAAIQALVGEELDPWERVLPDPGIDLPPPGNNCSASEGSGFGNDRASGAGWTVLGSNGSASGGSGEQTLLGPVAKDFLRLMGLYEETRH